MRRTVRPHAGKPLAVARDPVIGRILQLPQPGQGVEQQREPGLQGNGQHQRNRGGARHRLAIGRNRPGGSFALRERQAVGCGDAGLLKGHHHHAVAAIEGLHEARRARSKPARSVEDQREVRW